MPHCGRCVRKQKAAMCIYHPAPMTRARPGAAQSSVQNPERIPTHSSNKVNEPSQPSQGRMATAFRPDLNHIPQQSPIAQISRLPTVDKTQAVNVRRAPETPNWYDRNWEIDSIPPRPARYYGPTSFSSVFTENDLLDNNEEHQTYQSPWPFGEPLLGREGPSTPTARMNQVIMALRNIPSRDICESFMDEYKSRYNITMNEVLIKHAVVSLWSTFGEELSVPRTSEKLSLIAETLFKNEEKPLPPAPDDGMEWLDTFTGLSLRFEMLGMLFCFFGMVYHSLPDSDHRFRIPENPGWDRRQSSWRMKECADICLKMCKILETNNEISVALMLCNLILESHCTGDESLQIRRRHADTIVSALAAGLHRLDCGTNKVTAALEYKRRVISAIYCTDKNESSMNGIPVSLSQNFVHLQLPLDLPEEALFQPQEDLARAVSQLDSNGWNRNGEIYFVTIHRGIQVLSRYLEKIIEIALTVDLDISPQQIDDLYSQCQLAYDSLPPQIHYYDYGTTPKESTGRTLLDQAYLMLINLQNKFLIDRVATARGFANDQRLLDTAMEMLELSNMYWIKRDQLTAFYNSFDWIVKCTSNSVTSFTNET